MNQLHVSCHQVRSFGFPFFKKQTIGNVWKNKKQISNRPREFLQKNKKRDYAKFDGVSYKPYCAYFLIRVRAKIREPGSQNPGTGKKFPGRKSKSGKTGKVS